ncbi:Nif3-like dinuclear metal center hexameric protein [Aeromicrobium wangtongii]|uniref:GTP cyclohydrolase 1 type 2 homolog n=1 Tax=Aeromicrobium wangtongii TaxID=2969247 RepID=A0ABY5MD98_9ACTN|nr:Nif3-like dinuclear metal center hexameric protein [Aeromicrobium wangtongii]MCD9197415.1 Nif3-like dinuclear metal center hexameric protein [Aeromicrobium wangtongii]UUP14909.1 Nif3-like dinuclear metal center hexameric protein [Aeromicrobium wangtongii]
MTTLRDVVSVLDGLYDPAWADDWDAVGTVVGDPHAPVAKVLFAVDPVTAVVDEAVAWGADLVVVHHPLWLKGVTSVAADSPKGRVVHTLISNGIGLHTCHTNADCPPRGVSESMAFALGVGDVRPLEADDDPARGSGRIGTLDEPMPLHRFAQRVAERLPSHHSAIRIAGDADRMITTVALCGGSGDFLLSTAQAEGADVYVTSDLRHHPVSEHMEQPDACAVVDVPHWSAEWTWLPVAADALSASLSDIEVRISTTVTDPWTAHLPGTVSL